MELICLNTWGSKIFIPQMDFLKRSKSKTDIYCFQEVFFGTSPKFGIEGIRENSFFEIAEILAEFDAYFSLAPLCSCFMKQKINFDVGVVIFVNKSIEVINSFSFYTYDSKSIEALNPNLTMTGNSCVVELANGLRIINLHGLWQKEGKTDTEARHQQNRILTKHLNSKSIICGDFNLTLNTNCIKYFENDFINHIRDKKIAGTRSSLYNKSERFADYIFSQKSLTATNFKVFQDEISDHLALGISINN